MPRMVKWRPGCKPAARMARSWAAAVSSAAVRAAAEREVHITCHTRGARSRRWARVAGSVGGLSSASAAAAVPERPRSVRRVNAS